VKAVLDTNILVDFLRGIPQAKQEIERYEEAHISLITWIEILVGAEDEEEAEQLRAFMRRFVLEQIDPTTAERAVDLRRRHRMRLPDAVIWATALELGYILVTRNTRDFPSDHPSIRIPYQI
jgi:hypothetical protein